MLVVKRGQLPVELFRGVCGHCKSVLEAGRIELRMEWDLREQGEVGKRACPVCRHSDVNFYPKKSSDGD